MNAFVAPTDIRWFEFPSSQDSVDEVNFWMAKLLLLNPFLLHPKL